MDLSSGKMFLLLIVQVLIITANGDPTTYTKCGGELTPRVETIKFPAVGKYKDNLLCRWIISRPGRTFKVVVTMLDIERQSTCRFDYLRLGSSERYCGNDLPREEISTNGRLVIYFKSDRITGGNGFTLQITDIAETTCWEKISPGCALSSNIIRYHDKSVQECQTICLKTDSCVAVEYGVAHGGPRKHYKPRDCQLNNSTNSQGCDGVHNNLDFYVNKCNDSMRGKIVTTTKPQVSPLIFRASIIDPIPLGWRLITKSEVEKYKSKVKSEMNSWSIVKLADGWCLTGSGYGDKLKEYNHPEIKEQILIKEVNKPCGGLISNKVKTIRYPDFGYHKDTDCTWFIDRPGEMFQVVVVELIKTSTDCKKSFLQFGYGPKYCGKSTPPPQKSRNGKLQFYFHSDHQKKKGGFTIQIISQTESSNSVSTTQSIQVTPATTTTVTPTVTAVTPQPGVMPYLILESGMREGWRLLTKSEAEQYALKLRKFGSKRFWIANIANGWHFVSSSYGWNHIIQHGADETVQQNLLIRVFKDPNVYDECGGAVPSTVRILRYPYNNENYPKRIKCVWTINRPGENFLLRFKMMDIPKYWKTDCSLDSLKFPSLKQTYCGVKLPKPVKSQNGKLVLKFESSYLKGGKGFELDIINSEDIEKKREGEKEFRILKRQERIPGGWRIAAKEDVELHLSLIKRMLSKYSLLSLDKNWSVSGWGSNYQIKQVPIEQIQLMLIIKDFEDSSEYFGCGGDVPSEAKIIRYPPSGRYSAGVTCMWNISRPHNFKLQFIKMNFPNDKCKMNDYIEVENSPLFCAKVIPPDLYSQGGLLKLKFVSNSDVQDGEGFVARIIPVFDANEAALGRLSHSFPKYASSGYLRSDRKYSWAGDDGDGEILNYPGEVQISKDEQGRFYKINKYYGKEELVLPNKDGRYTRYTKKSGGPEKCVIEQVDSSPPLYERNLEGWRLNVQSMDQNSIVQEWKFNEYWDDDPQQYGVYEEYEILRFSISAATGVAVPVDYVRKNDMVEDDRPSINTKHYSYQPDISDERLVNVTTFCKSK